MKAAICWIIAAALFLAAGEMDYRDAVRATNNGDKHDHTLP